MSTWQTLDKFANGYIEFFGLYDEEFNAQNNTSSLTMKLYLRNLGCYGWGENENSIPAYSNQSYIEVNGTSYYFSTPQLSGKWEQGYTGDIYLGEITINNIPCNIDELTAVYFNSYLYLGDTFQVYTENKYTYITLNGAIEATTWGYAGGYYYSSTFNIDGSHILGETDTITITPSNYDVSVTHTLKFECGEESGTIIDNSSEDIIEFRPKVSLSAQNPSNTYVRLVYTLITHFPNGATGSKTLAVYYDIPELPDCTVEVTDSTEYSDKYGGFIQGKSCLKIVVTPSEENTSPIVKYKIYANGETFDTAEATTSEIKDSGDVPVTVTITDQRGCVYTETVTVSVAEYRAPEVPYLAVCRSDENGNENQNGEYVKVSYKASVSKLNGYNSLQVSISYGKTSDTDLVTEICFEKVTGIIFNVQSNYIFPADKLSSYIVVITVTDDFIDGTRSTQASTAITLMNWKKSGLGIAFGTTSEIDNVFENAFKFYPSGGYKYPVIEENNTLNDFTTPNTLIIPDLSKIYDAPIDSGRGVLEVFNFIETDDDNSPDLTQRLTVNVWGEKPKIYIRQRSEYAWSAWVGIYGDTGTLLTAGIYLMHGEQELTLLEPISNQPSGIVLIFSGYDVDNAEIQDDNIQEFFVSKHAVNKYEGCPFNFTLTTSDFSVVGNKNLTISDTTISGHSDNSNVGTGASGIKFDNRRWVLRYVIGV